MKSYAQYFVLQVLFVTWTLAASNTNYCDLCKVKGSQTVCARPGCPVVGLCAKYQQKPFTSEEQQLIVKKHNELRNKVATGNQSGQPKAANMNTLKWNDELAYIAQCWANACVFQHDKCRDTHSMSVGQNIAFSGSTSQSDIYSQATLSGVIDSWYNEVDKFHGPIDKYSFDSETGHYTQLVWAETTDIGCGKVTFKDGQFWKLQVVCNYGPAGNYIGQSIYKEGNSCSQCQNSKKCNQQFTGLCS